MAWAAATLSLAGRAPSLPSPWAASVDALWVLWVGGPPHLCRSLVACPPPLLPRVHSPPPHLPPLRRLVARCRPAALNRVGERQALWCCCSRAPRTATILLIFLTRSRSRRVGDLKAGLGGPQASLLLPGRPTRFAFVGCHLPLVAATTFVCSSSEI